MERVLREFDGDISSLAWSNDGSMLLTAADKVVKLWNVKVWLLPICPENGT